MVENGDSPPAGAGLVPSTTLKKMNAANMRSHMKRRGRRTGRGRKRR